MPFVLDPHPSRIRFNNERLCERFAIHPKPCREVTDIAGVERAALIGGRRAARTFAQRVPDNSMHSCGCRERLRSRLP